MVLEKQLFEIITRNTDMVRDREEKWKNERRQELMSEGRKEGRYMKTVFFCCKPCMFLCCLLLPSSGYDIVMLK